MIWRHKDGYVDMFLWKDAESLFVKSAVPDSMPTE